MPHPLDAAREGPLPFRLAVVAPPGFDAPGLDRVVPAKLRLVTGRVRERRRLPVSLTGIVGQPVAGALPATGWPVSYVAAEPTAAGHLRCWVLLAATCDAVVFLHGPEAPDPVRWAAGVCDRLGVKWRAVPVTG